MNVYNYLDYLLTELPELDYAYRDNPELLDKISAMVGRTSGRYPDEPEK